MGPEPCWHSHPETSGNYEFSSFKKLETLVLETPVV
jgi:hypothetical protein